jgi:hypothetical protein
MRERGPVSTIALIIFTLAAMFMAWYVPWYHRRDPDALVRYVPRVAAGAALLGSLILLARLIVAM